MVLRDKFAMLERALINFMLDTHVNEFKYIEISPPIIVNEEVMFGTGQLPKFEEDQFEIKFDNIDDRKFLIPTAEVVLTNLVRKSIINADDLSSDPEKLLKILRENLEISFSKKMLKWPKGKRKSDGLWGDVWYQNVKSSTCFDQLKKNNSTVPLIYKKIYNECELIYNKLTLFNVLNGR